VAGGGDWSWEEDKLKSAAFEVKEGRDKFKKIAN
jgi:hypothetical protein